MQEVIIKTGQKLCCIDYNWICSIFFLTLSKTYFGIELTFDWWLDYIIFFCWIKFCISVLWSLNRFWKVKANENYCVQKMSILLSVCSVLLSGRKHVSNLCMAEGSANTKVVLYCWAHHCQVLTSQGITQGITEPPNFQLFATNTAKAIYSRTNYFLSFFWSLYICVCIGS